MKEQHHQQHSLRMEQYQRNSKHASTSSSARGIVATPSTAGETTAVMMATANQMRATLIYLAPFLHPCKNVVPGTKQQQQHQQQQKQHQQQQEMANILPHPRSSQLSLVQQYVEETLQQQTHVAHGGSRVAVMPVTGTRTSDSSIRSSSSSSTNNNRNVTTMSCASSTQSLLQKPEGDCSDGGGGGRNNHNNNAINCNSTFINASKGGRQHCCNISFSAIRSSCCHNNAAPERHDSELQKHKQLLLPYEHQTTTTKKDNPKHKDKFYENYEMPALETTNTTTTTSNTTTMLYTANNKIRQHNHHQQQQQQHNQEDQNDEGHLTVVVEKKPSETPKKIDNPSSSSSSLSLYPTMSGATMVPPPLNAGLKAQGPGGETSFVNYTNGRSTKYLRERGRRYFTIQQQQQQQLGHDSGRPLKKHEEFQLHDGHQQRTKSPCGLSVDPSSTPTMATCASGRLQGPLASFAPYAVIDNHNTAKCCNNNQMANTSLLSRCHCLNNMLSNGQDTGHKDHHDICDGKTWTWTSPDNGRLTNIGSDGGQHGHCHPSCTLRNSCCESCNQRETDIFSRLNENLSSAENCNALRAESGIAMTSSSLPLSSSSVCPLSSLYPASASSPASISTSYTTILNKECRCFKSKRDIIIDSSETQRNPSSSSLAVAAVMASLTSSTLGASESHKASSPSSSAFSACLAIDGCCTSARSRSGCRSSKDKDASSLQLEHSLDLATPSRILPSSAAVEVSPLSLACWFWQWCCWWLVALFGCSKLTKTVTVSKWLFMWLLLAVLSSSAHCWAGRNDVPTNCTFPARWEGSWFLSGYQQSIHIKGSQFSYRGRCAASDGNKYLIVDEKGCHRCLVIYEKHKNVLQYKESECEGDSMYMHQSNPSAMAMRSVINQKPSLGNGGDHRGGAHPNSNGHSRLSSSDQYIMRSNDDMNDCPPDFCKGRETLQNLCDQIPGDALLYSLFRESADPVKCPLKGPFIFTYNRGNGECKSPVSNIESCTEDSRLLLSFQACPDVVGTESTVEELTCLATWKDGNSRYLVGLVSHHHAISNEERYRCFVYEKISSLMDMGHFAGPSMSTSKDAEYKLAQSGDATCNGLDSAEVGSRIMSLRKPPITERCDFPAWFKGPRHWHVLMGNAVYNYHTNDGSIHIIKPNGYMDTRALCEQINKQTATEMMSVVHYTTGCQSGFMCMMFYRRDTHIIEIQTGKPASRLEDACAPDHFDINKTPYITLLASNPDPQICPMEGLYTLRGAIGPPYMTTRHKRNHNNKVHGIHNHHHQYESNERGVLHRRHASLSFRNTNPNERNAWHSNTRGIPGRSRRDASSTTTKPNVTENTEPSQQNDGVTQAILVVGNNTNVGFVQDPDSDTRLRSRRNVPECITNYKAQRQLWIGCTEPNLIDVRPLCNDEGDEEYSCHGSWTENGTVYIIARHKGTKHGVCISYRPTEGNNAKLVVGDACYRGTQKPPEHHLEANLSVFGKCGETGSSTGRIFHLGRLQLMTVTLLNLLLSQLPIQR